MAQLASAERSGVLRAVVVADEVRLDVVLPCHLAVAELRVELIDLALRAGARPEPAAVLVDSVRGVLDPAVPLSAHGIEDGAILALRPPDQPIPFRPQHQVADAVHELVLSGTREAHPRARADVAVATAGVLALLLAGISVTVTAAGGAQAPFGLACAIVAALVAGATVHRVGRDRTLEGPRWWSGIAVAALIGNGAAAGHGADLLWTREAAGRPDLAGVGLSLALVVVAAALLRAPASLRPWSGVPLVLLLGVGLLPQAVAHALEHPLERALNATLGPAQVTTGLLVAMLLAAGPLASAAVDALVVRPTRVTGTRRESGGPDRAVHPGQLTPRVLLTGRVLVAVDLGVLLLALLATPQLVRSGSSGLALWGSVVILMLLRVRGERLADRVLLGAVGGILLLVVGVGTVLLHGGPAVMPGPGSGVFLTSLGIATVTSLAGVSATGASVLRRPGVVLDRAVRVLLPSVWVLGSGLLPGWTG